MQDGIRILKNVNNFRKYEAILTKFHQRTPDINQYWPLVSKYKFSKIQNGGGRLLHLTKC
jgi:hypothetical protein